VTAATHGVVRVRWPRGACTSPLMPLAKAEQEAERIREAVEACGDGWGFVHFAGHDGRSVRIRGRDVITVEWVPDLPDRIRPPAAGSAAAVTGAVVGTLTVHGGPPATGTSWLQQQAARRTPEQIADAVVRP
jgi:hypothetical protein